MSSSVTYDGGNSGADGCEQKRVLVLQAPATFPLDVPVSRYRPSSRAVWENTFQTGV